MQTEILGTSAQAVKHWSTFMSKEAIGKTFLRKFMGTGENAIIQLHQDLRQGRGDQIKYDLRLQLAGYGVTGSARLKGNEKRMEYAQDSIGIDQQREGINYDSMSQQRTLHQLRRDGLDLLSDWAARVMDETVLAALCGTAADNTDLDTVMNGFGGNAFSAPDAAHLYAPGAAMTVDFIRELREKAVLMNPILRPTQDRGEGLYVLILRPEAITSMKNESGSSKWREVVAQAKERGSNNPIFTGAIGMWDGVVIHESRYLPRTNSGNINYGLFLGSQAGHIAFGNPYAKLQRRPIETRELFSVFEDRDDYDDKTGIAVATIWGFKKAVFNSKDFGVIRLATTEAPA